MANKTEGKAETWVDQIGARLGVGVKRARIAQGLTAEQLSKRTDELGYRIPRVTISKIENNIRGGRTDIAEISILAVALGVSPLVLVYPDLDDTPVQLYPGVEWPGISAALWATGSHFASGPVPPNYAAHAYVTTAFEVDRLRTDLDLTTSLLGKLSGKSEPDRVRDTMRRQEQIHDLLKERERDLAELRESWVSGPKGYALESSLVEATDG